MTLEKAIQTLPELFHLCKWPRTQGQIEALNLAIEALKEIRSLRGCHGRFAAEELPGETKE